LFEGALIVAYDADRRRALDLVRRSYQEDDRFGEGIERRPCADGIVFRSS